MAAQLGNYVLETATAPGTGGFTLNGAEANRRSFSAAFPNGGNVLYFADDGSQAEWGIGTLTVGTPSTLARSTVLGNTAGTKVALNFPGSVEVYNEIPAEMVPVLEQDGSLTLAGGLTVNGKTIVQKVDDFTSQEAVPAAQADGRYLKLAVGLVATDTAVDALWVDLTTEKGFPRFGFTGANGTTYGAYGVAKVNALISGCIQNTNPGIAKALAGTSLCVNPADSLPYLAYNGNTQIAALALDSQKLGYSGGQVNYLRVGTSLFVLGNECAVYNSAANAWVNTYVDSNGNATWDLNGGSPDNNTGNKNWFRMAPNGHLQTGKGTVAFQDDLPVGVDQRIQSFSVSIADGGSITFPVAFSGVPTSIQLQCMQTNSRITVANPTSAPQAWGIPSVGIQIVAGDHTQAVTTPITVWVTAIGPK